MWLGARKSKKIMLPCGKAYAEKVKMTDTSNETTDLQERLTANLEKVEEITKRLIRVMASKKPANPGLQGPSQELFAKATTAYWTEMLQNPAKIIEHQVEYWGQSVKHYLEIQQQMARGQFVLEESDDAPTDKRFANPLWSQHPYFRFMRDQYLVNAHAIEQAIQDVEADMSPKDRRRLDYFAHQIIDMLSPTNFLGTNPDALEKAVETEGQSLVDGLENLVKDLEANDGELVVRLADEGAFEIGGNIATAPGEVVFRNELMELIQYAPTTDKVHATPVVIFPPWINKFYILDLKEQNSLIRWIVDQGYTLFVVSWRNPDASMADIGMDDYVEKGFLTAIEEVKAITKQKKINAIGYCIAGTTLSLTLALMKKRGDTSIKSATFFTALTDFSDQGEFTPFLQDDFIEAITEEVDKAGVLQSFIMARTFSFLRSNDLVYGPAIRSYMMGEAPPAFDLLYWNGDGSNLPGRMAKDYLHGLCRDNRFTTEGYEVLGEKVHVSEVDVPLISIACETDHIARWKDVYRGVQMMGGKDKTFVVSESGHIAGIVNPPSKKKYGHYLNDDLTGTADDWLKGAKRHDGSWWPMWEAWIRPRSGKMVDAREPGDADHKPIAPAPGAYVKEKSHL